MSSKPPTVIPVKTGIHRDAIGGALSLHRLSRAHLIAHRCGAHVQTATEAVGPGVRRGDGEDNSTSLTHKKSPAFAGLFVELRESRT